jgi:hypothetical protein
VGLRCWLGSALTTGWSPAMEQVGEAITHGHEPSGDGFVPVG